MMQMNFENIVSITKENNNISKIAHQEGNNETGQNELLYQLIVGQAASSILSKHLDAIKELSK